MSTFATLRSPVASIVVVLHGTWRAAGPLFRSCVLRAALDVTHEKASYELANAIYLFVLLSPDGVGLVRS